MRINSICAKKNRKREKRERERDGWGKCHVTAH